MFDIIYKILILITLMDIMFNVEKIIDLLSK